MAVPQITSAGKVLVGGGTVMLECCCTLPPASPCYLGIKERQRAYGITLPWSPSAPVNPGRLIRSRHTYSLAELKDYVNALCTGGNGAFIADGYSGGASQPIWLPTTYANSATTEAELCALVQAMRETRRTISPTALTHRQFNGAAQWYPVLDDAIAAAIAAYTEWLYGPPTDQQVDKFTKVTFEESKYRVEIQLRSSRFSLTGLSDALTKTVKFWDYTIKYPNNLWNEQDIPGIVENEYYGYYSAAVDTAISATSGMWPELVMPDNFGSSPAEFQSRFGWQNDVSYFATIAWDFAY